MVLPYINMHPPRMYTCSPSWTPLLPPSSYHPFGSSQCMVSFKPTFSFSSFTYIKSLFSSSLLSAIKVVSSAYLRLLIFLPAILIPVWPSSSLAFHMINSAYKLNKQGDNIHSWHTPFPAWGVLYHWCHLGCPKKEHFNPTVIRKLNYWVNYFSQG